MYKNSILFFLSFFVFLAACGSPEPEEPQSDEPNPTESPDSGTQEETTGNETYTIKVVDPAPKSPRKEMTGSVGDVDITINYGSPQVKGRIIWGSLEQYDEVWRAGANEATTFNVSADLMIAGEKLPAGKYSFFLIPRENGNWTAIFNSEAEQWGAYEYDASRDVLRVDVSPEFLEENKEELDYMIDGDQVVLRWAKASIALPVSAS